MAKKNANLLSQLIDNDDEINSNQSGDDSNVGTKVEPAEKSKKIEVEKADIVKPTIIEKQDIIVPLSNKYEKQKNTEKANEVSKKEKEPKGESKKDYMPRSFYLHNSEYELIEKYYANKRISGDYDYTKRSVLAEALSLLRPVIEAKIRLEPIVFKKDDKCKIRSFSISIDDSDFIDKVVIERKKSGLYDFTQANALSEALSLLRKKNPNL